MNPSSFSTIEMSQRTSAGLESCNRAANCGPNPALGGMGARQRTRRPRANSGVLAACHMASKVFLNASAILPRWSPAGDYLRVGPRALSGHFQWPIVKDNFIPGEVPGGGYLSHERWTSNALFSLPRCGAPGHNRPHLEVAPPIALVWTCR
jgi:hypothetical protein